MKKVSFWCLLMLVMGYANAGNCVIQGNQKIGDCSNVNISSPKPLIVSSTGSYSDTYSSVLIKRGGKAFLSGIANSITVEAGGELFLSGVSGNIDVFGAAEISGTAGWITAHPKSTVTVSGIARGISGSGTINRLKGSIIDGVQKK